jgi:hypothetical protein
MRDDRTYDSVLALHAGTSTNGLAADSFPFDHEFLVRVATWIINEVRGRQPGRLRRDFNASRHYRAGVGIITCIGRFGAQLVILLRLEHPEYQRRRSGG